MNKIYKVKKNAAGHLVACSEFAKGHTKKAVLGSLLIVGILGMATTASAQKKQAIQPMKSAAKARTSVVAITTEPKAITLSSVAAI